MASNHQGDSHDLRIVLLGVSGAGKSSIGNAILGRKAFKERRTRESEKQTGRVEDRNISIIDTPGFFNTHLTDEEMRNEMMKSMYLCYPGPHVFLLVINLETFREEQRNIVEQIQENFGAQAMRLTMVLFTGKETMPNREWMVFKFSTKFQDLINHCRNNYFVINSKTAIDSTHIAKLLENIDEMKQNDDHHYNEMYFKYLIKSRKEKKKQEEAKEGRKKEHEEQKIKTDQKTAKIQSVKQKSTTHVVPEKKSFSSQGTNIEKTEVHEDRHYRVQQEKNNDEEEMVKQSVKLLRSAFEKNEQKPNKCWKPSRTVKWDQHPTQTGSEFIQKRDIKSSWCTDLRKLHLTQPESTQSRHTKPSRCTDLRIVMVGKTGAGKSATGNTILGQKVFKEELSTESVTKICQQHWQMVEDRIISVMDTPGLFDTKISEEQLKSEFMKCIHMSALHVFLLVIRLDVIFTDEENNTVKSFQKNFGEEATRYTIILFTRGDQLKTSIEAYLTKNKQIRELVRQCKGGYHVFNNTDEQNQSQVTELLEKIDRMVMENRGEQYTDQMYKEAQRRIEEEKKKQREEEERLKLEEEEKIRQNERMKILNKVKDAVLLVACFVGAAVGGGAAAGGGPLRGSLISLAVLVVLALVSTEALVLGAVIFGAVALVCAKGGLCLLPASLEPLIQRLIAVVSKAQVTFSLKDSNADKNT